MVEVRLSPALDIHDQEAVGRYMADLGIEPDPETAPVPMDGGQGSPQGAPSSFILNGTVSDKSALKALEAHPDVIKVWGDSPIAPFAP